MSDDLVLGIDCGATKVMAQSGILCSKTNKISPGSFHKEYLYSDHPDWNPQFDPVPIATQKIEYSSHNISLTQSEVKQGKVITETIIKAIEEGQDHRIGLCFPGLKDQNGILVMANGPRIPDLKNHLKQIKSILNDSDCCVMGELKSTIGQMQNIDNGIYIGGGTGIADGIIFNGDLLKLNDLKGVQRSWEIHIDLSNTVESLLSPAGMINNYNKNHKNKITNLATLSNQKSFNVILENALNAFSLLVENRIRFFNSQGKEIQRVVIGQRLGQFLNESNVEYKNKFKSTIEIPLKISSDRRTAALGAALAIAC